MKVENALDCIAQKYALYAQTFCDTHKKLKDADNEMGDIFTVIEELEKFYLMWERLCDVNVNDDDEYVYPWTKELFNIMVKIQKEFKVKGVK